MLKGFVFVNRALTGKTSDKLLSVYCRRHFTKQLCLQLYKTRAFGTSHLIPSGSTLIDKNTTKRTTHLNEGPDLEYFIANSSKRKPGIKDRIKARKTSNDDHPYLSEESLRGDGKLGNYHF